MKTMCKASHYLIVNYCMFRADHG